MQTLPANIERYLFTVSNSDEELHVASFEVTEGISQLFNIDLELVTENDQLDFEEIIGQTGCLTIQQYQQEEPRYFHGIISRFEQGTSGLRFTTYYASIVPKIWYLMHRYNCRIFQKLSVPDIVKKILNELGIPNDEYRFVLRHEPPKREYCVQYRESEFDFISRLLEEEGIFYFFEHQEDKHILVMGDNSGANLPIKDETNIIFHEPRPGQVSDKPHVYKFHYTEEILSGKVTLKDYNFTKPALNVNGQQSVDKNPELEIYDYPGKFENPGHGKYIAKVRLEECQTLKKLATGATTCTHFAAGFFFSMEHYPRDDFNKKYLIIQHQLSGTQSQVLEETSNEGGTTFSSNFECIPFEVPYRPQRVTPKPVIDGNQTAIVVGPPGEEIYPNEHGQVKVQFHWDREGRMDQNSSCWIRVSHPWAGQGWGAISIPRIGQEVVVDFLEGDPDRPIITGRVYHGTNRSSYGLPANKTRTTIRSNSYPGGGGYNELRYEDKKGEEEVYLQAEKDWNILVKNDKTHLIKHDETLTVDNDRTRTVHHDEKVTIDNDRNKTVHHDETLIVDRDRTRIVHHDEKVTIDNDRNKTVHHDETLIVDNDRTRIVHHDEKVTIDNDRNKEVKNNQQEKIGGNKTIKVDKNHTEKIDKNMSLKVGKNKTDFTAMASAETVGLAKALSVGAAYQISVGAMMNETVGGMKMVQVGFSKTETVAQTHTTKANKIIMEAQEEIVIKCGGGTITFDAGGNITIKGTIVKINT